MSEVNAENADNSEEIFEGLIENLENEEYGSDTYAKFDRARHEFYDTILETVSAAYEEPLEHSLSLNVGEVAISFEDVLKGVYTSSTSYEDFVGTLTNILTDDAQTRADFLSSTLRQYGLSANYYGHDVIDGLIRNAVSNSEETSLKDALGSLVDMYVSDLTSDMHEFLQVMLEKAEQSHIGRGVIEDGDELGSKSEAFKKHVVDVAKIAAGVSIAFAVEKLLKRTVR
ncbi:hypothetical protein E6P97_01530 [Patescibacteria group bacterium]|nr:MAG: hypothetical protein E6P97_01530 [Patescibacteria group bacterium]